MQVISNGPVRRGEAEWQEILARWEKSGQKPAPFYRREERVGIMGVWRPRGQTRPGAREGAP